MNTKTILAILLVISVAINIDSIYNLVKLKSCLKTSLAINCALMDESGRKVPDFCEAYTANKLPITRD